MKAVWYLGTAAVAAFWLLSAYMVVVNVIILQWSVKNAIAGVVVLGLASLTLGRLSGFLWRKARRAT